MTINELREQIGTLKISDKVVMAEIIAKTNHEPKCNGLEGSDLDSVSAEDWFDTRSRLIRANLIWIQDGNIHVFAHTDSSVADGSWKRLQFEVEAYFGLGHAPTRKSQYQAVEKKIREAISMLSDIQHRFPHDEDCQYFAHCLVETVDGGMDMETGMSVFINNLKN